MTTAAPVHACHGNSGNHVFGAIWSGLPPEPDSGEDPPFRRHRRIPHPLPDRGALRPARAVRDRARGQRGEWVPLTIADYNRETGELVLVMQVVGLASHKLDELREGDR